jgi:hypothetical protein
MSPRQRFNINLDPIQVEFLQHNAAETGVMPSERIRRLVYSYMEAYAEEHRPALEEEAARRAVKVWRDGWKQPPKQRKKKPKSK